MRGGLWDKLPVEVLGMIAHLVPDKMTREEAEKIRLELMDERSTFTSQNNDKFFEVGFNMCEQYVS